jgi:hypothetical protein
MGSQASPLSVPESTLVWDSIAVLYGKDGRKAKEPMRRLVAVIGCRPAVYNGL